MDFNFNRKERGGGEKELEGGTEEKRKDEDFLQVKEKGASCLAYRERKKRRMG